MNCCIVTSDLAMTDLYDQVRWHPSREDCCPWGHEGSAGSGRSPTPNSASNWWPGPRTAWPLRSIPSSLACSGRYAWGPTKPSPSVHGSVADRAI